MNENSREGVVGDALKIVGTGVAVGGAGYGIDKIMTGSIGDSIVNDPKLKETNSITRRAVEEYRNVRNTIVNNFGNVDTKNAADVINNNKTTNSSTGKKTDKDKKSNPKPPPNTNTNTGPKTNPFDGNDYVDVDYEEVPGSNSTNTNTNTKSSNTNTNTKSSNTNTKSSNTNGYIDVDYEDVLDNTSNTKTKTKTNAKTKTKTKPKIKLKDILKKFKRK